MDLPAFDFEDADVTLLTSDGISFKVHSTILKQASPFFNDLFTLPQPASSCSDPAHIPERGEVVRMLLVLVYPMEEPEIDSISLLSDVLGAALKYDVVRAIQVLRRLLVSPRFMQKHPIQVYAVACRHNLSEEVKLASANALAVDLCNVPFSEELEHMPANALLRLIRLRALRVAQAQTLFMWDSGKIPPKVKHCANCGSGRKWWCNFSERARLEMHRTATTDVIFSLPFLIKGVGECSGCAQSMLESHEFLMDIKKSIEAFTQDI